jgi:hypothetical protein
MRLPLIIASIVCSLFHAPAWAKPPDPKALGRKQSVSIQVEGNGWGEASPERIEKVLHSVADELMSHFSGELKAPIVVTHTEGNPIALYERGPHGEYLIQLHATGTRWHLYVYEFAHELCHLLSNYGENIGSGDKYNQWFEETLCETASLYTLKALAAAWAQASDDPDFAQQASRLEGFFNRLLHEGHRQLPPNSPLSKWLNGNEEALKHNPYLREKNEVVANLLLPLFEKHPENWATLAYLNLDPQNARLSLRDYLNRWYRAAPPEHRAFIGEVLSMFEINNVMPPSLPAPGAPVLATTAGAADLNVPGAVPAKVQ